MRFPVKTAIHTSFVLSLKSYLIFIARMKQASSILELIFPELMPGANALNFD